MGHHPHLAAALTGGPSGPAGPEDFDTIITRLLIGLLGPVPEAPPHSSSH